MIHCAITTHATPEPAVAYATINGVCRPRCQMHIARARRDGCTVRLRPLTPEPETVAVTRAAYPNDPQEPTMPDDTTTPPADPDIRAKRSEAARKGRRTREANARARAGVASAPVVEQPAPVEPVTLIRDGNAYVWPSGRVAIAARLTGEFRAWADAEDTPSTPHPTPEAAAAHLGARLPDAPGAGEVEAPRVGRSAPPAWRDPFPPIGKDGQVLRHNGVAWEWIDFPAATTDPTPRERELQAQIRRLEQERDGWIDRTVEADKGQAKAAGMLADIALALDKSGKVNAPEQTTADRVRALIRYVGEVEKEGGHYGTLCSEAHAALTAAGIPLAGQPADRIRILAERQPGPAAPQIRGVVAGLLADLEDVTDAGEAWGIHLVRALRLAVGVES